MCVAMLLTKIDVGECHFIPYKQFLANNVFSNLFTGPTLDILNSLLIASCLLFENVKWPFYRFWGPHLAPQWINFLQFLSKLIFPITYLLYKLVYPLVFLFRNLFELFLP
jgi:hypothetical protein